MHLKKQGAAAIAGFVLAMAGASVHAQNASQAGAAQAQEASQAAVEAVDKNAESGSDAASKAFEMVMSQESGPGYVADAVKRNPALKRIVLEKANASGKDPRAVLLDSIQARRGELRITEEELRQRSESVRSAGRMHDGLFIGGLAVAAAGGLVASWPVFVGGAFLMLFSFTMSGLAGPDEKGALNEMENNLNSEKDSLNKIERIL